MEVSANIVWHKTSITKQNRNDLNGHRSFVLWFTGLSGSGKSTLANEVESVLFQRKYRTYLLDGDNVRQGLNKDLGFKPGDRKENIRRIAEVSRLFIDSGVICITAFISPYREEREMARSLFPDNEFIEVYVKCPLEVCEDRDPKGLYKNARSGLIQDFTGISAPYEVPLNPDITIDSSKFDIKSCVEHIVDFLVDKQYLQGL